MKEDCGGGATWVATLAGRASMVGLLQLTGMSSVLCNVALEPEVGAGKQGIVVTARVHPGETNSSWIMRGLLLHITGSTQSAEVSFQLAFEITSGRHYAFR